METIGAAIGLCFVIEPAIGSTLSPIGPAVPFLVAISVAVVNALLVLLFLPETHKNAHVTSKVKYWVLRKALQA
jgi:DHA1 family tetracycline resistance protein-like MFS transporter